MLKIVNKLNRSNVFNVFRFLAVRNYSPGQKPHVKRRILIQETENFPVHVYPKAGKFDKRLYVWGLSETGALGVNESLKKQSQKHAAFVQHPTRHRFAEKYQLISAACGYGFSLFTVKSTDGYSVFGTGINTDSQLGYHRHRGKTNRPIELLVLPAPIDLPDKSEQMVECAAGRAHSVVLSETGTAYTFGNNAYGQCGRRIIENEDYAANSVVQKIEIPHAAGTIRSIVCGQDHSMFVTTDGAVYSCGWSADGQTGLGHYQTADQVSRIGGDISEEKIVKIVCTADCVLALNDRGEVFGWGNSEYGQLRCDGDNQQINSPQFVEVTKSFGKIVDIASGGSVCMVLNGKFY